MLSGEARADQFRRDIPLPSIGQHGDRHRGDLPAGREGLST